MPLSPAWHLQGVLLQIFTKPLGDRPTVFFEIIQRLCVLPPPEEPVRLKTGTTGKKQEKGGSPACAPAAGQDAC